MLPIRAFSIENFKSFGPEQRFQLGRINFLFGPNSHGKSSTLLALGILTKGFFFKDFTIDRIVHSDNSPDLSLGGNLINTTSESDEFCLGFEISFGKSAKIEVKYHVYNLKEYGLSRIEIHEIFKGKKHLVLSLDEDERVAKINVGTNVVRLLIKDQDLKDFINEDIKLHEINNFHFYLNNLEVETTMRSNSEEFTEDDFLIPPTQSEFNLERIINKVLNSINYLVKEHYYDVKGTMDRRMGEGKSFDSVYYDPFCWIGANRYVPEKSIIVGGEKSFLSNKLMNTEAIDELNKWLSNSQLLPMNYEFILNDFRSSDYQQISNFDVKEFGVTEKNNKRFQKLTEVGSGLGHIFQILIPFFNNPKLIIVQQPEIHLHPSLQIQLARAMISISKEKNIQLVIETHSEHFIKAAQLEIAKGLNSENPLLISDDVSVLYVTKNENGFSTVKQIELDQTGAFTEPWPDDFFELSADLSLERLRNSIKSRN